MLNGIITVMGVSAGTCICKRMKTNLLNLTS